MNHRIHIEDVSLDNMDTDTHKLLDLVRRLETSDFVFATDPKVATDLAKSSDGTPTQKLIHRAEILDETDGLTHALHKGDFLVKGVSRAYAGISFILGFMGVVGLLSTQLINFFYVLIGLLGWHTVTLVWWVISLKNTNPYSSIYGIFDKIHPKSPIQSHAFDIYLEEFQQNDVWQLGKITHQAWLFGLLGSIVALLMMFLFKSYTFVWESTLLSPQHFVMMLKVFGFVPSLFGFDPTQIDPTTGDISHARLAILIMMSVVIYGMIPRFGAYWFCRIKTNWHFHIDGNLYYYENLIRIFSQKIIDKDDFTPTPTRATNPITPSKNKKVIATLEWVHSDDTWYEQSEYITNVGAVDTKEDITHLLKTARAMEAQIVLGIDVRLLPDRGVLRKLDVICQHSTHGIAIKLLGNDAHVGRWQQLLVDRHLPLLGG